VIEKTQVMGCCGLQGRQTLYLQLWIAMQLPPEGLNDGA
jgi:hypothetical protein